MTTFAELAAALRPDAASGAAGPAGPPLAWVRVMRARVPAFDALDAGDVAILPASVLDVVAPGPADVASLIAALARARVGGALLVEGDPADVGAGRLGAVQGALIEAGLPCLRLAKADVAALERTVIGLLVNVRAELERQAGLVEARLEALALEGGGAATLVAAVAGSLGRAVALEGRRGDPLVVHAPPDVADAAAAVARYHARPRAVALRVTLPSAAGPLGSIALLGERPAGELERVVLGRVSGLLALELARDEAVLRARRDARRAEALPAAGPPWVVLLARQRTPGAEDDTAADRERREAVRRELRTLAPARRLALRGDADSLEIRIVLAVHAVAGPDPEGLDLASRIATFLGRTVALSRPFAAAADRPAAEAEARDTLQSAERLVDPPRVARASRAAAYRLLGGLHSLPDGVRHARDLLAPLLEGRPDISREHLATLRALLDHGGVNEAAAALGVHRNTIAYRVRRIEALTDLRLSDPELRLPLALAVRLVQDAKD